MPIEEDKCRPDLNKIKSLRLKLAQEYPTDSLLKKLVHRMATEFPNIALVRTWLIQPGDICSYCPQRTRCPDQTLCLHLVASGGKSHTNPQQTWNRLDGDFRRVPLGIHRIGKIATSGQNDLLMHIDENTEGFLYPDWFHQEQIRVLSGMPLLYKEHVIGVFAIFAFKAVEDEFVEEVLIWQRLITDLITSAVANHRAFEEINDLNRQLRLENQYLQEEVRDTQGFGDIIGRSPPMQKLFQQIEQVAPTDTTVLIQGESGTGKELVARAIHQKIKRCNKSLIKVNCPSIPRDLFESEFFGHARGSFTGAIRDRVGRFQLAHEGTIFLDELGDIPYELQSKLLRVIQEGQFERIGEDKTRSVNVRIIAATNLDLETEVKEKRFRQDLFYRFNVFPIQVAPLRERIEDIPLIANHFLKLACQRLHKPVLSLKQKHITMLQNYPWPGNIRELQNVIERAAIISSEGKLHFDLPLDITIPASEMNPGSSEKRIPTQKVLTYPELKQFEKNNILAALEQTQGKVSGPQGAADLLMIKATTLLSRMKAMGIQRRTSS